MPLCHRRRQQHDRGTLSVLRVLRDEHVHVRERRRGCGGWVAEAGSNAGTSQGVGNERAPPDCLGFRFGWAHVRSADEATMRPMKRPELEFFFFAMVLPPPPPADSLTPNQSDFCGKKRHLPLGKSGRAIVGTQIFGSQTPPPQNPPL